MKNLTRKSLNELANTMPRISEMSQRSFIGGGNGSQYDPYTTVEYDRMVLSGTWAGGYVEGWGYTSRDVIVTNGTYDVNNAVNYLTSHANGSSTGACAKFVRLALEAGGMSTVGRPASACDYDTWLQSQGWRVIHVTGEYAAEAGDIVFLKQ